MATVQSFAPADLAEHFRKTVAMTVRVRVTGGKRTQLRLLVCEGLLALLRWVAPCPVDAEIERHPWTSDRPEPSGFGAPTNARGLSA